MKTACIDKRWDVSDTDLRAAIEDCFDSPHLTSFIWDGDFFSMSMLGEPIQRGMVIRDKTYMVINGVSVYAFHDYKKQELIINRTIN